MPTPSTYAVTLALPVALLAPACGSPDPKAEIELRDVESYWAVDPTVGGTQYLAPVVRFQLVNKAASSRSIQAMATFRRKGEGPAWSSAWHSVSPLPDGTPLPAGKSALVVLKPEGEGRYTFRGTAEEMFQHLEFKDVTAEVFVRVGSSSWTKFADADIPRRLGSQTVEGFK
jgi:hypothetical protein